MENIHEDVLDLDTFNYENLDFENHNQISYKENGIQFINIDFQNTTFRIDNQFIDICRMAINAKKLLINHKPAIPYSSRITKKSQNVSIKEEPFIKIEINFHNCKFSNIIIKEKNIKEDIIFEFNNNEVQFEIDKFIILNSSLGGKFYINKQYSGFNQELHIKSLKIIDTVFEDNFKLHNTILSEFGIEDSDFYKYADFFKSKFLQGRLKKNEKEKIQEHDIGFKAINFKGLALFGDTVFKRKLIFKYVTFESFSHFRKSKLYAGLDLDYSNIQNEMNFFDVEKLDTIQSKNNTSQETYRIIKHNFEKIGNKIEANKYFALELEQKKINLENNKFNNLRNFRDYIVFKIHWFSSEFGTNWGRALLLICLVGLITVGLIHINLLKQLFYNPSLFKITYIEKITNEFFQYLYILNKSKILLAHPAILLFNKITLGYLYYQFLNSIRKDTRK